MGYQSTNDQKYYKIAEAMLDAEVDLTVAAGSKNEELAEFAKKLLRKIAESREKDGRNQ